jgi:hypothetical protein
MEKNFIFLEIQPALNIIRNSINNTNNINNNNSTSNIALNLQLYNNLIDSFNILREHVIANNFSIDNIITKLKHFKWSDTQLYCYNNSCFICMANFENSHDCIQLNCKHIYHYDCIKKWIKTSHNSKCVVCKI